MTDREWFRRSTWTPGDAAEFRARLGRSRGSNAKAQYLRLQAHHLQAEGSRPLMEAALSLLDELVRDHPDPLQLAAAHEQRAECLAALDRKTEALDAYRDALAAVRAFPNVRGLAYLGFAELVLALGRRELYAEALQVIEEFSDDEPFPILRYRSHAARAFLHEELGDHAVASAHAGQALHAAAESESPFRHHRTMGLVETLEAAVQARLRRLALDVSGTPIAAS